jgi:hypothetical protein
LKLSRFVDAEKDAEKVLQIVEEEREIEQKDLLSFKTKALFRRGLARRSMGGAKNLSLALSDFSVLLSLDGVNKQVFIEKSRTEQLMEEQQKTVSREASSVAGWDAVKGSDSQGEILMSAVHTVRKNRPKNDLASSLSPPPSIPSSPAAAAATLTSSSSLPTPPAPVTGVSKKKGSFASPCTKFPSKSPLKPTNVSTDQPKTVYELERVWRGMKSHPEIFAEYIASLKNSTIKKVFNDNVSSDLFSSLFEVVKKHIVSSAPSEALRVIDTLTRMKGFTLTASLWPETDLTNIRGNGAIDTLFLI